MIQMEFNDIQKIWDTQDQQIYYRINEVAMHKRILAKKHTAVHITNTSEWVALLMYPAGGLFILAISWYRQSNNIFLYLLGVWMLFSALVAFAMRWRRIHNNASFERSMAGDLAYAVAIISYQVRFSHRMWWSTIPIAVLSVLVMIASGKSPWFAIGTAFFFLLAIMASRWEHRIYVSLQRELVKLQEKLSAGEEENI